MFNTTLEAATNADHLTDFNASNADAIFLSRAIFSNLTTLNGALGSSDFGSVSDGTGETATFGAGVHIIYDSQTGNLFYDSDGGNTTSGRSLFAVLDNAPSTAAFTNADILVGA